MDSKEFYEKTEEFAKKIINFAVEDGLTVKELCMATDIAQKIAESSMVDNESVERADYPSHHIVYNCGGNIFEVSL